ncbi:hypothetical protein L596_009527 [Steinernema carpocapsae]|uniref:Uncharacterized protein n=1 Tax=Steinernema carpocapsae TaxID=34508 RepID=A0A4U5PG45_STECR|nr:hypothetical protein L596_009527 [Steinernema carpocapsae]
MLLSKLEDDDETEEGEASEQEASDEKECEESHEEWLDSTMSSAPSTLVYSDDSDDEDPGFIEDLDYHQACTKLLIGLLRKAKKKGEEFASCGQTLLTVWDRTGIKDAKIEKPAEVAAFLAALTKYASQSFQDSSTSSWKTKACAVDASVSNIAQCARWIRAPFVECLAEVHELLEDKQQQKRLRFLASTLYFAFDPLDWRLRNLLTHEFTKIVATIDDPKIIEAEFTDMGQVLVKERAFDNRLDLCYLLAVTMSRLVEFQDMDRAKRFASLLETQMLHSEDHRCRFAFATVCGFLLREFMISDADFDKILGDNFFIFLPHDRVNTVRGKFRGAWIARTRQRSSASHTACIRSSGL